ncbi:MAG: transcriptional repressor LexA [Leptospiraceae bacterium]|nr:transcriptional repressor LexA [Leptospiraceae bacterium]
MKDLTSKQEQILKYIIKVMKEKAHPPTIREIADNFEITTKGAYDHVKAIEKKGFIRTHKNQARAIELIRENFTEGVPITATSVPLIGRVAAGQPILAEENIEDYVTIPDNLAKKGQVYALRVVGDSMIEAGIFDRDIAIIQKKETARNGEIVVAMVEGEATLKYFYKEADQIRLEPANKNYQPILTKKAQILGRLIGILRYY